MGEEEVVDSPLGLFETSFDVITIANQGADCLTGVDGLIQRDHGLLAANLTTPISDGHGRWLADKTTFPSAYIS